jgi:hypothetical protein
MLCSFETNSTSIPASSIRAFVFSSRARNSDRSNGSFTLHAPSVSRRIKVSAHALR